MLRVVVDNHVESLGSLETYTRGVVPREMPAGWPAEALKAQAVCARTFAAVALRRPRHGSGGHLCNGPHCQVWSRAEHPATNRAVEDTAGLVLWWPAGPGQRVLAQAFYSARCGGHTGLWVPISGAGQALVAEAQVLAAPELATARNGAWKGAWIPKSAPWCRPVECSCATLPGPGGETRKRKGHGVGLCQWGARAMAEGGATFEVILQHYFAGVEIGAWML